MLTKPSCRSASQKNHVSLPVPTTGKFASRPEYYPKSHGVELMAGGKTIIGTAEVPQFSGVGSYCSEVKLGIAVIGGSIASTAPNSQ